MGVPSIYQITRAGSGTVQDLHETAITFAENQFALKGQVPFLWLIDTGEDILWMETPWENESEKDASIKILRVVLRETNARAYAQMVEAWVATETYDPKNPKKKFVPPSERAKDARDDVLMVTSYDADGKMLMTRYLVTVRNHGPNFLGPRVDIGSDEGLFEGRMFGLLKDKRCPACREAVGHKPNCVAEMIAKVFTAR